MEDKEKRWEKERRGPMVGNLQHMAPPRIQQDHPNLGEDLFPPFKAWRAT